MWLPRGNILLVVTLLCVLCDVSYVNCKNEEYEKTSDVIDKQIGNTTDSQLPRNAHPYTGLRYYSVGCRQTNQETYYPGEQPVHFVAVEDTCQGGRDRIDENLTRTDVQVGCKELRAKRFISDGFCTSTKPLREVVCAGQCLPIKELDLPWWAEFVKYWARTKIRQYRCEEDVVRRRKVRLRCTDGETRTYRIKVVKSCKCKRYAKPQNDSRRRRRRRRKSRKKEHTVSMANTNSSNDYKP